ncbi:unnamed protein product [Strongylus vulgaris]|uniref:Uncharacterized protein n=1 Tax=Strongylus vulgaris TaxID=40348 RepID=A0A3P7IZ27_STRVU|nr:unnamed protein product [Strongylus vulgaris]
MSTTFAIDLVPPFCNGNVAARLQYSTLRSNAYDVHYRNISQITPCSSAPASPRILRCDNDSFLDSQSSQDQSPPRLLRPPPLLSPYPDSSSPPRSNSIDLSTLRRDIELLSVSSRDSGSDSESEPPTPADSVRTVRSRSHDPTAAASVLRRPSRIEHLSELFRKALAKSPVVRRTAVEEESRTVNKHRTSRYWLDEQVSTIFN